MERGELISLLESDAGNPVFADYAKELIEEGALETALLVCLRGVGANPSLHSGRLLLARVFYELNLLSFASRELELLCREIPDNAALRSLLEKLSPDPAAVSPVITVGHDDETVAELEVSFEDLQGALDSEKE